MRSEMWRLLALLACACLMPASAMAQCGTTPCNPASKHPLDWFDQLDGMGGTTRLTDVTDVAGALVGACPLYARAHSNAAVTARFDVCTPNLPIPAGNAGGSWASFSITGTVTVFQNSNGLVVDGGSGVWGLGQGGCTDSLNSNLPAVGTDGQCYCPAEFIWSKGIHACQRPIDRYLGGGSPNACSEGKPIYPLTGAKILNEPLLTGPLSLTAHYDTRRQLPVDDPNLMFDVSEAASFGPLWSSSLHKRVQRQMDGTGLTQAVQASRGDWISFMRDGAGNYAAATAEVRDRLYPSGAGWLYVDAAANAQEFYDSHGNLQTVTRADGSRLTYEYSSADTPAAIAPRAELILKVSDQNGRAIQFQYLCPCQPPIA